MLLKDIWLDVKAVQERDPAARSALEVLLLYQGEVGGQAVLGRQT